MIKLIYSASIFLTLMVHDIKLSSAANLTELVVPSVFKTDPDQRLTLEELIAVRGFALQSYSVETEDGYILTVHRVVPKNYSIDDYTVTRKPVIVQHGLLGSSNDFFINSPFLKAEDNPDGCGDTFGFCLVMTGRYDIWLPNSRGTHYSTGHVRLSSDDAEYWKFSFDQMALFDAPAVIDFVQRATGHDKVGFLGYSQGANILLALLSLKPEYADVIEPAITWAPPALIGNMTSPERFLYPLVPLLQRLPGKFVLSDQISNYIVQILCKPLGQPLCNGVLQAVMGPTTHLNETRLPVYFHFFPSTVSNWNMAHFGQLWKSGKFIRYDYGKSSLNQEAYGQTKPPEYPLENIPQNFTISIIRGPTDAYISSVDAEALIGRLRAGGVKVQDYEVPSETWNHLDYVIGMDAGKLVHDKTVEILDQFNNEE